MAIIRATRTRSHADFSGNFGSKEPISACEIEESFKKMPLIKRLSQYTPPECAGEKNLSESEFLEVVSLYS